MFYIELAYVLSNLQYLNMYFKTNSHLMYCKATDFNPAPKDQLSCNVYF